MNTPSATFSTNHIKLNNPAIIITTFPFEFPSAKLFCIYELSASVYTLENCSIRNTLYNIHYITNTTVKEVFVYCKPLLSLRSFNTSNIHIIPDLYTVVNL